MMQAIRTHHIVLTHNHSPFAMSRKRPCDSAIFQLLGADLTGVGAIGLVEDVLSCNFDFFADVLTGREEVESWRGDDDFYN